MLDASIGAQATPYSASRVYFSTICAKTKSFNLSYILSLHYLGVSPGDVDTCDFRSWLPSSFYATLSENGAPCTGIVSGLMPMSLILQIPKASFKV